MSSLLNFPPIESPTPWIAHKQRDHQCIGCGEWLAFDEFDVDLDVLKANDCKHITDDFYHETPNGRCGPVTRQVCR